MRVLLDATAVPSDRGGVGRYVDELVPELARAGVDLVLAVQARDVDHYRRLVPGADLIPLPGAAARRPLRMLWEQTELPRLVRRVRPDVVHSPHYTMPLATGAPVVVTVHDATFFTTPELHLRKKAAFFRSATRIAARRAAGLIVPSLATRDEVARLLGADRDLFTVAYHGVDRARFHPVSIDEQARVRSTLEIDDLPYVGFLGTLEPRKNVPALIRAWVRVCADLDHPPALVLAGGRGWDEEIDTAIAQVPPELTVRRPGYLPLEDLPGFLAGATVLAYPSLAEGFGLPVLEAMASGATVLTSRELSLPEVGGEAVAYCGTSTDEISAELGSLIADPEWRSRLARAGVARAAEFTWARTAQRHVEAYERALTRRGVGSR